MRFERKSSPRAACHPEGMDDNSPTFQGWVRRSIASSVPKGRLKTGVRHETPRFQPSLAGLGIPSRVIPKLKHWAILKYPSGINAKPKSGGFTLAEVLAALVFLAILIPVAI